MSSEARRQRRRKLERSEWIVIKFTPDEEHGDYIIRTYHAHKIVINDRTYAQTVLLTATTLIAHGLPKSMKEIHLAHIDKILALNPSLILIGSGQRYQGLNSRLYQKILTKKIGLEIMPTPAACRTFNILMTESRNAAALLFVSG